MGLGGYYDFSLEFSLLSKFLSSRKGTWTGFDEGNLDRPGQGCYYHTPGAFHKVAGSNREAFLCKNTEAL